MSSTITKGIVSEKPTLRDGGPVYIQLDVAISPGNNRGPLLDDKETVIGISVATLRYPKAQAVNFFMPIEVALQAISIRLAPGV
jgi:S1-C subfamily serine protease